MVDAAVNLDGDLVVGGPEGEVDGAGAAVDVLDGVFGDELGGLVDAEDLGEEVAEEVLGAAGLGGVGGGHGGDSNEGSRLCAG